ncbi:MAG TPA: chemotaxis protein CheD [Methanolinea sp.]|nr:chemotaxis protein CheD [Methanolinea sp.]HQK55359.1 chemotaxis protein CheD [Methanolinea sp.]
MPGPEEPTVIVGIGEFYAGRNPMSSIGLGSCIGLVIYDKDKPLGALAHIMLPDSQGRSERPAKYADTAVKFLVKELNMLGCRSSSLAAKICGGASMFQTFSGNLNIGERNVEAIKFHLKELNIPIVAEDVGGIVGRTIVYNPAENGKVSIKTADGTKKII